MPWVIGFSSFTFTPVPAYPPPAEPVPAPPIPPPVAPPPAPEAPATPEPPAPAAPQEPEPPAPEAPEKLYHSNSCEKKARNPSSRPCCIVLFSRPRGQTGNGFCCASRKSARKNGIAFSQGICLKVCI